MFSLKRIAISTLLALTAITQLIPSTSAQSFYVNPGYSYTYLPSYNYGSYGYNPYSYYYSTVPYGAYGYYGNSPGLYLGITAAATALGIGINMLQARRYYGNYGANYGYPYGYNGYGNQYANRGYSYPYVY